MLCSPPSSSYNKLRKKSLSTCMLLLLLILSPSLNYLLVLISRLHISLPHRLLVIRITSIRVISIRIVIIIIMIIIKLLLVDIILYSTISILKKILLTHYLILIHQLMANLVPSLLIVTIYQQQD